MEQDNIPSEHDDKINSVEKKSQIQLLLFGAFIFLRNAVAQQSHHDHKSRLPKIKALTETCESNFLSSFSIASIKLLKSFFMTLSASLVRYTVISFTNSERLVITIFLCLVQFKAFLEF